MRKPVTILLIALFATAVCADELKSAASGPRADVMENRSSLVERISTSLRRMVKPTLAALHLHVRSTSTIVVSARPLRVDTPRFEQAPIQPFQFRLPPPIA